MIFTTRYVFTNYQKVHVLPNAIMYIFVVFAVAVISSHF